MNNSPTTKSSMTYRMKKDEISCRRKAQAQTVEFKKRRRQLFNRKTNQCNKAVRKEGICYESGCGLDVGIDFVDTVTVNPKVNLSSAVVVFFDLETTGLDASKEVVQIAAKYSDVEFDIYIKPEREFSLQASKITGLELKNSTYIANSNLGRAHSKVNAAKSLLQFLKSINSPIILVAHNCFRFDCPTLLNFIRNEGLLNEFSELVAGFADSLPLFKSKLKDKRGTKASYRQEVLAEEFLNASY
ncbi:uncharacterized protein LOC123272509 [Cotesia glomerata]|nr:uncharacterized protein LOC123272509 [Cotesia glomerata]